MNNTTTYELFRRFGTLLTLCWLLLSGGAARAQSGPVGNEWIVPGQRYFKIKIDRDGIYKLNQAYLSQAGITGVAPSRLQVWRRGREMAVYGGGNQTTLDATTFLEFYAVHNDARLDGELYKQPADQSNPYYSFYTDTAAYFLTWNSTTAGKRMVQPVAAGGAVHPHRLASQVNSKVNFYLDSPPEQYVYLPWLVGGEGFFGGGTQGTSTDSVVYNVAPTGPAPTVEVMLFSPSTVAHAVQISVTQRSGTDRIVGVMRWNGRTKFSQRFQLLRSDVQANGRITIRHMLDPAHVQGDDYYTCYFRYGTPQVSRWQPNRHIIHFQNDSLLTGPATYEFAPDSIPATVAGFDVQDLYNVQRIANSGSGTGPRRYVFPSANASATHQLVLADEAALAVPPLPAREVVFRTVNPATPTFIIITHPLLMKPDTSVGVTNAAQDYATYRASTAGGGYNVLMVTAPELYDQFTYGDRSWLALRHFSRWLVAANPTATNRYLLLLGKGIVPSEGRYYRTSGEVGLNLVPCSSRAVSDNLLTADYANNDYVAKLHTGRLTVTTPRQIVAYLNKLRTHDALGPAPWRKNVLHLVGAKDANETQEFSSYLNAEKVRIERPFLGGNVTTRTRTGALPVSVDISAELNAGLSLIDYFGHGQNNIFSLDFSAPSKAPNYNNPGKYPVLFLNGCAGTATCVSTYTVVEDYLFAEQKGAIGALGESGFGFSFPLSVGLDSLHKLLFNDPIWYGRPITVVHDEVVRRLQHDPVFTDDIGIEQLLSTNWQGDPTIALYSPALPDLVASNATLSISPLPGQPPVTAASSSFVLNVGVSNPGKITFDPVEIRVTRVTLGKPDQVYNFTRPQAWTPATSYALTIPNAFVGLGVNSTFKVVLDPANKIAESNENNNAAQIDFTFLTGGLSVLNPTEFAIVATATPRLTVQSNNPNEASRGYEFELDTDPAFTSAAPLKKTTTVTAGVLAEWQPTALPTTVASRDSVVWYWRARFQTPAPGEDGAWVTSSFRVIPNSPAGWSQSHHGQFKRDALTGVDVSGPWATWTFAAERVPLVLRTAGGGPPRSVAQFGTLPGGGIYLQSAGLPVTTNCGVQSPNLLIAVYDPGSLRPLVLPAAYQRCGQAPNYAYYFSASAQANAADTLDNLNYSTTRQQQLDAFLTAIPNNAYVAVLSTNRLRYSLLPTALKARLQTLLGSQLITTLADGEPLALVGQKLTATTGRLLQELGPDRSSTTAAYSQRVELNTTLDRPGTTGHVVSTQIGPAQQWNNLYTTIRKPTGSGQYTLNVVGIDATGTERPVLSNVPMSATAALNTQPLSGISATAYPYLRLDLTVSDTAHVAPQLQQWLVTARGLPEGVVQRDAVPASTYAAATLLQQATSGNGTVSFPVKFKNVSTETFSGPLSTRVQVRKGGVVQGTPVFISTVAPLPGETATINASISVAGLTGLLTIEVVVNPRPGQPEQNYANNELLLPTFNVIDNNVPPTLDVAIDNRHILNGELVSSTPVIVVQLNDEDQIVHVRNRNVFTLTLQRPGQGAALVPLSGANIGFEVDSTKGSRARLTFEPGKNGPLPDGKYTLRVQGRDPSSAAAAAQEVQLTFEVVNAATISNVYPYPNPIISKARFVFTVTGHELPRNMKIQIMSLTGRVVREIFMSELGPLHIGNNITEYAWDGTDSYGDRLANGTYLYRVAYDDSNVSFSHRDTVGDKAFKNDWGKLVLMR